MTPTSSETIFYFNTPHLPSPGEFYGRARERTTLLDRTGKGESTSIIGPRRIGKTWLTDYLKQMAPTRISAHLLLATLDGTMPGCRTVAEFTTRVLDAFGVPLLPGQTSIGLDVLEELVRGWQTRNIRPVLCIDEFEGFLQQQNFDCDFYAGLRYIATNGLVLVIVSKTPLIDLIGERCKTSGFFNIFHQLTLRPFDNTEAEEFASTKSKEAGFTDEERDALLRYGQENRRRPQWPPLRLQLAGQTLHRDKRLAAESSSHYYRPTDPTYWQDFQQRLEETYRGAVR